MTTYQPVSVAAVPIRAGRGVSPLGQPIEPILERARGVARLGVRFDGGRTRLVENYQSGSARLRFPRVTDDKAFTGVLVNTAGGVTGGDHFTTSVAVGSHAAATVTTQAAERIYRRSGGVARIDTTLAVADRASLDWLPQETILFNRSALARTLTADVEPSSSLLAVESIVLGRAAMGETVTTAALSDRWRIRRGGRMVFADGLRLDGDTTRILAGGATGNRAMALATLVLVAPDAEARLAAARQSLEGASGEAGVSAWNGMLVARLIATGGQALRADLIRLIEGSPRRAHAARLALLRTDMNLTPREKDKLIISMAAIVARRRLERGVKLNHPEAIALITDFVVEGARDGRPVAHLMEAGAHVISRMQVMEGVAEMIHDVQVEATFPDGTKLVTVHNPIR